MSRFFDGVDDGIAVPSAASVNQVFDGAGGTWAAWVYATATAAVNALRILDKRAAGSNGPVLFLSGGTQVLTFFHDFTTTDGRWFIAGSALLVNQWYHVAVTYASGSTANNPTLYLNGDELTVTKGVQPVGTRSVDTGNQLLIGSAATGLTWPGVMAYVHCYRGLQLSERQVNQIRSTPGSVTDFLSGFWPLYGEGIAEGDYSGNGNSGVVTGAVFSASNPTVSGVGVIPIPIGYLA